jgi:hypothetical protein
LRALQLFEHHEASLADARPLALEQPGDQRGEVDGRARRLREAAEPRERLDDGFDAARVGVDPLGELSANSGRRRPASGVGGC